jgi:hypothetical protein
MTDMEEYNPLKKELKLKLLVIIIGDIGAN